MKRTILSFIDPKLRFTILLLTGKNTQKEMTIQVSILHILTVSLTRVKSLMIQYFPQ